MRAHVWLLLFCFLTLVFPGSSSAQQIHSIKPGQRQEGTMTEWRDMGVHVIRAVPDPTTFVLDNGKVIKLSSVDLPIFPGETENPFAALALQRMQSLYLGQKVNLYQTRDDKKGRVNSMGQGLGHLVRKQEKREIWAQKILVEEGLARVLPTVSNPEGADILYAAEKEAREKRKGIWGTAPWSVKEPDSVSAYEGTIQVVQGTVKAVATRNNVTYLNFGKDWKTDFTIEIDANTRRALLRKNVNVMSLQNKDVEVRGYVENKNGSNIALDSPHLLRIIGAPAKAVMKEEAPDPMEQGSEIIKIETLPPLSEQASSSEEEGAKNEAPEKQTFQK